MVGTVTSLPLWCSDLQSQHDCAPSFPGHHMQQPAGSLGRVYSTAGWQLSLVFWLQRKKNNKKRRIDYFVQSL